MYDYHDTVSLLTTDQASVQILKIHVTYFNIYVHIKNIIQEI